MRNGFHDFTIQYRVNAWPGTWTVAAYGRLPYRLFTMICYLYGLWTGRGRELLAVAKLQGNS